MNIQDWFSELRDNCDTQAEYCYSLLALHVKNCEKISNAIEEHGSDDLQKAVSRPYAMDEKVVNELVKEMGNMVEKEQ